jgi:exodeoxyribonuclease VIII
MGAEKKHIEGMSGEDYHAHNAISKTTLDLIHDDPHAVRWSRLVERDEEKLGALDFGDAMHAICLEPERLKSEFVAMPDLNLRTNAGKQERDEFLAANAGKKILTADEYRKLHLMFDSVMSHPQARDLIESDGICEGSYFWKDEETGLPCKCRPDKEIESRGLLVDVKSTDKLSKFTFSVEDFRYYVQDPFYCDGVSRFKDAPVMLFLVIQKHVNCGRYPVKVCRLPDEAIMYGRIEYKNDMRRYAKFLESGEPLTDYTELPMHFRFIDRCMESLEVQI